MPSIIASWIPRIAGLLVLAAVWGCDEQEPEKPKQQEVILNVRTVDLQNQPVEMVRFYINGKKFGITDQDGSFKGRYPAADGDTLTFNVEAPPGYSVPPNVDQSRWQLKVKYPSDGRPLQVDFTATLQRPERDYLFMVRTKTPATPVKVNDRLVGKTGATGYALLRVGGVPGTKFSARAEEITLKGQFAEEDAIYLITPEKQGQIGGEGAAVAAADPPAPPEPAQPEPEPAQPEPPPVEPPPTVAVAPDPEPEPVAPPEPARPEPARPVAVAVATPPPARERDPYPREEPRAAPPPRQREPAPEPVRERPARPSPAVAVIDDDPEPPPRRVAAAPPPAPIDDLFDPPSEPVAVAPPPVEIGLIDDDPPVAVAPPPPKVAAAAPAPGNLMDDGDVVEASAIDRKTTVAAASGPSVAGMGREEVTTRLEQIQNGLKSSNVLQKADVDFLSQIDRTHPGYYEANRLLADFYFRLKDYRRQADALEIAVSRGKYKHDPSVLLSLAKAYAHQKNFRKALSTMRDVEAKMRNLPPELKADAFRFHAEILEFEFLRQFHDDAKRANVSLVDKAITKWERYQTFAQGTDAAGVAKAGKKIQELNELKGRVEL